MKSIKSNIGYLRIGSMLSTLLMLIMGCTEEMFVEPKLYGSIKGQVLNLADKKPLTGVLVRISPSGKSITPDSLGNFKADSLLVGKYSIQTSVDKYKTDLTSIEVEENKVTAVTVYLVPDNNQNKPPLAATMLKPTDKSSGLSLSTTMAWKSSDPDKDSLSYSIILFKEGQNTSEPIATGLRADSLKVSNLDYESTYYWQVITSDSINKPVYSEVWSFKTKSVPDLPYIFTRRIDQNYQIFASSSTETIQLTSFGGNWRPIVSPNRERVAFISNINTEPHIFTSTRVGDDLKKITLVPVGGVSLMELSYCWSPDGLEILYPSYNKLYAVRADGSGLRVVAQAPAGRFFAGCDWTSQGNKIIARVTGSSVYDNELCLINPVNGVISNLVAGKPGKMGNPDFSVDGKQVLFTLDVSNFQNNEGRQLDSRVFLLDIASGTSTDISINKAKGTNDIDARFSPTDAKVILVNTSNDGFSEKNIYTLDMAGDNRVLQLTNGEMPYWR